MGRFIFLWSGAGRDSVAEHLEHPLLTWNTLLCCRAVHTAKIKQRSPHGYEPTREIAMAAFAKSWRRE
jgi:hypothetical protein